MLALLAPPKILSGETCDNSGGHCYALIRSTTKTKKKFPLCIPKLFKARKVARTHLNGAYDALNEEDCLKFRRRLTVYPRQDLYCDGLPITFWQSPRVDVFERREVLACNQLRKFKC